MWCPSSQSGEGTKCSTGPEVGAVCSTGAGSGMWGEVGTPWVSNMPDSVPSPGGLGPALDMVSAPDQ